MAPQPETVAVLGLGSMGHGMASSALRAGIPTIVWNRRADPTRDLTDLGAYVAETTSETVAHLSQARGSQFWGRRSSDPASHSRAELRGR
ncbi:MAG TPA: NAD(P)-binding domain-containing protein [Acidimicrobiia bacterium]|nr:NAD(P)-binding domain-containing protein [Acidimicrobiia bacterium]